MLYISSAATMALRECGRCIGVTWLTHHMAQYCPAAVTLNVGALFITMHNRFTIVFREKLALGLYHDVYAVYVILGVFYSIRRFRCSKHNNILYPYRLLTSLLDMWYLTIIVLMFTYVFFNHYSCTIYKYRVIFNLVQWSYVKININ